jgi:hypothetical protein
MGIPNEMSTIYEDFEMSCQSWNESLTPQFYDFETADVEEGDYSLRFQVAS